MAAKKKNKEKEKLNTLVADFMAASQKKIGRDVVMMIEDGAATDVRKFISTGSTLLDYAIANRRDGGIPVGKITEISGHESTGKTLLAMQIARNAQKDGALVIYIDPEHALNSDFAGRVGLDVASENFIHMDPPCMENVFEVIFTLFKRLEAAEKENRGKLPYPYVLVIWDSIPASPPKEDVDKENPNPTATVGLVPRILSKNLKQVISFSSRKNVAQVYLNQLRTRIGAFPGQDPYVETGGKALPYYASARIRLKSVGKIKDKTTGEILGIRTTGEVKKTRFGPPYRKANFDIFFTKGVDDTDSLMDFLEVRGILGCRSGGSKGTRWFVKCNPDDDGRGETMSRLEMKQKILTDPAFKSKLLDHVENIMVKDLIDPDTALTSVIGHDDKPINKDEE